MLVVNKKYTHENLTRTLEIQRQLTTLAILWAINKTCQYT